MNFNDKTVRTPKELHELMNICSCKWEHIDDGTYKTGCNKEICYDDEEDTPTNKSRNTAGISGLQRNVIRGRKPMKQIIEALERYVLSLKTTYSETTHADFLNHQGAGVAQIVYEELKLAENALEQARRLEPRTITDNPDSWPKSEIGYDDEVLITSYSGLSRKVLSIDLITNDLTMNGSGSSMPGRRWSYLPKWD